MQAKKTDLNTAGGYPRDRNTSPQKCAQQKLKMQEFKKWTTPFIKPNCGFVPAYNPRHLTVTPSFQHGISKLAEKNKRINAIEFMFEMGGMNALCL